jgi:hypothetical protein
MRNVHHLTGRGPHNQLPQAKQCLVGDEGKGKGSPEFRMISSG